MGAEDEVESEEEQEKKRQEEAKKKAEEEAKKKAAEEAQKKDKKKKDKKKGDKYKESKTAAVLALAAKSKSFITPVGLLKGVVFRAMPILMLIDLINSTDFRVINMDKPLGDPKPLSKGEIKKLKDSGIDPHDLKPSQGGPGGKIDIYKDLRGNLFYKTAKGKNYEAIYENFHVLTTGK